MVKFVGILRLYLRSLPIEIEILNLSTSDYYVFALNEPFIFKIKRAKGTDTLENVFTLKVRRCKQ